MSSKTNMDKKRVAHLGNKKKDADKTSSCEEDIVSEIIKSMDMKKKLVSYKDIEEFRERNQNLYPLNNEVTTLGVKQTKKYTFNKKHPLMEKCQKNLKYLKHNRSIPKQRAHVSEISIVKNINKKVNSTEKPNSTKAVNEDRKIQKKAKIIFKRQQQKSSFLPVHREEKSEIELPLLSKSPSNQAVQKVCEQSSSNLDSSDSECDFENFIRDQKEDLLGSNSSESSCSKIERAFKKHKRKKQKSRSKVKAAFNAKNRIPSVRKQVSLENSSSESSSEIEKTSKKHKRKTQKLGKSGSSEDSSSDFEKISKKRRRKVQSGKISSSDNSSDFERISKKQKSKAQSGKISSSENSCEIERSSKRHKRKEQKSVKSDYPAFNVSNTAPDKKLEDCDESDFETNESLSFNMDVTDSDSSATILNAPLEAANNNKSNECSRANSNFSLDLTKSDMKSYISKKFSCSVRVLRNPILDKKVISSLKNTDNLSFNVNQSNYEENKTNLENPSNQIKSNSNEDDCIIICEVPRSNSTPPFTGNTECSRESVLPYHNLSYVDSNIIVSYPVSNFKPDSQSFQESKNTLVQGIHIENCNDGANKSNNEFGIQILSVESLKTQPNDVSVDNVQNSIRGEEIVLNKHLSNILHLSDDITSITENKTFDLKKDYFKYAKTYSALENCNRDLASVNSSNNSKDYNSQIIPQDSTTSDSTCVPEINECLSKIDFELIKSTLKQASCSEYFSNNCDNTVSGTNSLLASTKESAKDLEVLYDEILNKSTADKNVCVKDKPFLPPHVLKMSQKIDFKKVLSLTKSQPNEIAENQLDWNIKYFNQSTNSERSLMTNSSQQYTILPTASNSCVSSANKINSNQEAPHHKLDTQSIESLSHSLNREENTFKTAVEKYIDSPSDELDVLATTNILDVDETKKTIIPLIKVYFAELNRYNKIKSAEHNVSEGLKILEETQLKKVINLEQAVQSFLQLDPCYRKIEDSLRLPETRSSLLNNDPMYRQENLKSLNEKSKEQNISKKQEAEVCSNCGLLAKLKCLGCEKEFFCSEKCGLKFWDDGHASKCQKISSTVKKENVLE